MICLHRTTFYVIAIELWIGINMFRILLGWHDRKWGTYSTTIQWAMDQYMLYHGRRVDISFGFLYKVWLFKYRGQVGADDISDLV